MPIEINRLFFALWPDEAVRAACAEAVRGIRLKMPVEGRAQAPERYHVTLSFLGSTVSAEQEASALEIASRIRAPAFTLTLDHASCFRKRHGACWLGASEPPAALAELQADLHDALLAARILPDRARFTPHLTFLRDARTPLPQTAIRPIAWNVTDFVLVRSRLDRQPPDYEVIQRWSLGGTAATAAPGQLGLWENAGGQDRRG